MNTKHSETDVDDCETTNILDMPIQWNASAHILDEHSIGCLCDAVRELEKAPNTLLDTLDIALLVSTASCKYAQPWLLNKLADSYWKEVRTTVVNNPRALIYTLLKLAYDFDADVRYRLAENENVPTQILKILQADQNPFVSYRATLTMCVR